MLMCLPIFLGGPMGPIHPLWANGPNSSVRVHVVPQHRSFRYPHYEPRYTKPSPTLQQEFYWCTCAGGQFRPNLNIQPIKKNGISPQPPNIDWKPFNLTWTFFEWLEHEILKNWDFGKMPRSHFSNSRKQKWFWKCPLCPDQNSNF